MAAIGILLTLVAACSPQTSPTATQTTAPQLSPPPTPGATQYDVHEATSQAETMLPPTFSAVAATQRVVDSTRAVWTSTPVTPATALPPTATAGPPTTTPDGGVPFNRITMFNTMQGWAWGWMGAYPEPLVAHTWHTVDGGLTWQAITPAEGDVRFRYAVSGQVTWVTVCTPAGADCRERLLRTLDGGATWEELSSPYLASDERTRFFNEQDGYIYSYGVAAGSGFYRFRETHDGGATWMSVTFVNSHEGGPADDPWGYHVCNICGDALYFDFKRMVVVGGGDPIEVIPVWVTINRGATWHKTDLDNPTTVDKTSWEDPLSLVFFPDNSILLPVKLTNNRFSEVAIAFYVSEDGGFSWSYRTMVEVPPHTGNLVVAPTKDDVFLACGEDLCVSHDGARTWQQIKSNLAFAPSGQEPFVRTFQFVDAHWGWALVGEEPYTLWRTTDGGENWTMQDPILLP